MEAKTEFSGRMPVVTAVRVEDYDRIQNVMVDLIFKDGILVEVGKSYLGERAEIRVEFGSLFVPSRS